MAHLELNQIVVLFRGKSPVAHNSSQIRELGGDGCRGRVVKVGKKWAYISTLGAPWKVAIEAAYTDKSDYALPVDEAKAAHRKNFEGPNEWRTPEFINEVINSL